MNSHRQLQFDRPTWKEEFTEEDIRQALADAKLSDWRFDVWSDGQITFNPPGNGACTKTELDRLVFSFGAAGARLEPVHMDVDSEANRVLPIGIRVCLEFLYRSAGSCVICLRPLTRCNCAGY